MLLQQQLPENQTIEIIKLLLPFVTLLIGFGLGRFGEWLKERKVVSNIKTVLFWELSFADHIIFKLVQEKGTGISKDIERCAIIENINIEIYERYFGQINVLNKNECIAILFAYRSLKSLKSHAERYIDIVEKEINTKIEINEDNLDPHFKSMLEQCTLLLHNGIITTKVHTATALSLLVRGRKDLEKKLKELYFSTINDTKL